jgi:hypothetical protein
VQERLWWHSPEGTAVTGAMTHGNKVYHKGGGAARAAPSCMVHAGLLLQHVPRTLAPTIILYYIYRTVLQHKIAKH